MQRPALALWRKEGVDAAVVRRIAGTPTGEASIATTLAAFRAARC